MVDSKNKEGRKTMSGNKLLIEEIIRRSQERDDLVDKVHKLITENDNLRREIIELEASITARDAGGDG
jgi:hypothetical protein